MEININKKENELIVHLKGRLDTATSPLLEKELKNNLKNQAKLTFDFRELEYISSSGLRVILAAQKVMNKQGELVVENANEDIKEVFEITGFNEIINIK